MFSLDALTVYRSDSACTKVTPEDQPDNSPTGPRIASDWLMNRFTQVESLPPPNTEVLNTRSVCTDAVALGQLSCHHATSYQRPRTIL